MQRLTAFQRLILVRILRPDKITIGISNLILEELGHEFLNPPPSMDIEKCFTESTHLTPIIYILKAGIDVL